VPSSPRNGVTPPQIALHLIYGHRQKRFKQNLNKPRPISRFLSDKASLLAVRLAFSAIQLPRKSLINRGIAASDQKGPPNLAALIF